MKDLGGFATSEGLLVLQKRRKDNIKEWTGTLPAQLGQLKTGQGGKGLLLSHL